MPIENLNGIDIYYEVHGSGEPIILIMGFGANSRQWAAQVKALSKEYKVITFDNRGVGKTERPNYSYTMTHFVEDIVALLDFLEIETTNLCGISMGGMITLQFVLAYPERAKRLILIATTAKGSGVDTLLRVIEQGESLPAKSRAKGTARILFSDPFRKKLLNDEALWAEFLRNFTETPTTLQDYRNQAAAIRDHDVRERLSEIQKPTLILVGTNDLLLPPRNSRLIAKGIPNAELHILKGPGHGITTEAADEVNTKILEFLRI